MATFTLGVITCYIGKLPWYFDLFVHSCSFNPGVDFIIITNDENYSGNLPSNMRFIYMDLLAINKLATKKLGFPVNIKHPYKLCDFKPSYGLLFDRILNKYDFWGHGDIDVIYGDIRSFITDDILSNYDIVSVRHEYITGFFALYRNNNYISSIFKESKDYQTIFRKEEYCGFDECSSLCMELISGKVLEELNAEYESMTHLVKQKTSELKLKSYFEFHVAEGLPGDLKWEKGILSYKDRFEILLYHLIDFKKLPNLFIPDWKTFPSKFFITINSISM